MDYLRIGDLRLGVNDGIQAFEETAGYNYVVVDLVAGKPLLQAIGETLSEISLNIYLRSFLGHNIQNMLEQIDTIMLSGAPQLLVFADGIYRGYYVIRERKNTVLRTNQTGSITEADISITLTEYAERTVVNGRNSETKPTTTKNTRKVTEK